MCLYVFISKLGEVKYSKSRLAARLTERHIRCRHLGTNPGTTIRNDTSTIYAVDTLTRQRCNARSDHSWNVLAALTHTNDPPHKRNTRIYKMNVMQIRLCVIEVQARAYTLISILPIAPSYAGMLSENKQVYGRCHFSCPDSVINSQIRFIHLMSPWVNQGSNKS